MIDALAGAFRCRARVQGVLLAALLAIGCATPIEERSWIRVETAHFELVSGAGRTESLRIARRLELFRAVLGRLGLQTNLEPRVPLLVVVFRDARAFAPFRPEPGAASYLLPRAQRNFLVLHAGGAAEARAMALHEYVHFVLRNSTATRYPSWYDEGLAEFLSTVTVDDERVVVGTIPANRQRWLVYGSRVGLRSLMTAKDADTWSKRAFARFQAQSWALVHFFHVADRVGFRNRNQQLAHYIALTNHGRSPDVACREAFQTDFEGLEQEFMAYLGKGELPYLGMSRDRLEAATEARTLPLSESDRRLLLGELALALGDDWRDEATKWFRLALQSDPALGRAHAALGRVLSDPGAADARFAEALAIAANDPEVHRLIGEAWLERAAEGGQASAARARHSFERSIELDPDQVGAYVGLGRSFLDPSDPGDLSQGVAALRIAHERQPADPSIALDLARLETAAGSPDRARTLLARLPPASHGDPLAEDRRAAVEAARLAAGLPPRPPRATRHLAARLEVFEPREGQRVRGLTGWIEARGHGGLWEAGLHDVLIAIDESPSTFLPSGSDLDGDGIIGTPTLLPLVGARIGSSDPDDTILHAERLAARALIRQLDPRTTRVGIVTFAEETQVLAPLDLPDAALKRLDEYPIRSYPSRTSLASPLDAALDFFFESREEHVRRQRTILLLSDGQPTAPNQTRGKSQALAAADRLGEVGIPVRAYALGEDALADPDFYRDLAERSGGEFVAVENPADVVDEFANVQFAGLADVAIHSAPSGLAGRAVRIFPNGAFDGYVPLSEGENVISIIATTENGEILEATRTVYFERPGQPDAAEKRQAEDLRERLQNRVVEIELLQEMRQRPIQMRRLEMEVEPVDERSPAATTERN